MRVIASTIPLGHGGAGDYLTFISEWHKDHVLIAPWICQKLKPYKILSRAVYVIEIFFIKFFLWLFASLKMIRSVVFHHPQSLGYALSAKLVANADTVNYWVLDCSFFCKKSYNAYQGSECVRCLKSHNPHSDCHHFPRPYLTDKSFFNFRETVTNITEKILFHVQTSGYEHLLGEAFLKPIQVVRHKMIVPDFFAQTFDVTSAPQYDFLYHANPLSAKGYNYFISLAEVMRGYTFFVPSAPAYQGINISNIFFEEVEWHSGLQNKLKQANVVLCPSIWSAPVEAAVIKSFLSGKPVGLICTEFGFSNEIPKNCFVPLTGDPLADSHKLKEWLNDKIGLEEVAANGLRWAKDYISSECIIS